MSIHIDHTNSPLHFYPPLPIPWTLTYGTIVPPSPSHDSSAEIVTPEGNPTPHNNPQNPALNVPADPGSDPSFSNYSLSYPSDSSDGEYSKQRQQMKNYKKNCQSKNSFNDTIKKCAKLTAKLLTAAQKWNVIMVKWYEDPLHRWHYFLSFMIHLNVLYHNLRSLTCLLWNIHP